MTNKAALAWLCFSLHTLRAADPSPAPAPAAPSAAALLQALPPSLSIVLFPKSKENAQRHKPQLLCGDPAVFDSLHFDLDTDPDIIHLAVRENGKWQSLIAQPASGTAPRVPLDISITTWLPLLNPTPERCISNLAASWVAEKDQFRRYQHTEYIALYAPAAIQERYAAHLIKLTFSDPCQRLSAIYIISRVRPQLVFQRYFGILIAPIPPSAKSKAPAPANAKSKAKEQADEVSTESIQELFRYRILDSLGTATDATNFEHHWAWMQKASDDNLKKFIFGQLLRDPFLRKDHPLDIPTYLRPHRAEILDFLRSPSMPLAYDAYLALGLLDPTLTPRPLNSNEFTTRRAEILRTLAP